MQAVTASILAHWSGERWKHPFSARVTICLDILNDFHLHGKSTYLNMLEEFRAMGDYLCCVVHVEGCVRPTIKTQKPWGHRLGLLCYSTEEQPQGFLEVNVWHLPFKGLGVPQSVRTVFSHNQTWNGKRKQQGFRDTSGLIHVDGGTITDGWKGKLGEKWALNYRQPLRSLALTSEMCLNHLLYERAEELEVVAMDRSEGREAFNIDRRWTSADFAADALQVPCEDQDSLTVIFPTAEAEPFFISFPL